MPWNWSKPENEQAKVLLNYDRPTREGSPTLPRPYFVQVPGFELIVFIGALVIVGLILKHKKKKK